MSEAQKQQLEGLLDHLVGAVMDACAQHQGWKEAHDRKRQVVDLVEKWVSWVPPEGM